MPLRVDGANRSAGHDADPRLFANDCVLAQEHRLGQSIGDLLEVNSRIAIERTIGDFGMVAGGVAPRFIVADVGYKVRAPKPGEFLAVAILDRNRISNFGGGGIEKHRQRGSHKFGIARVPTG